MVKVMIFAAGLGTRLKSLTDHKPKALVELNGKTLLEHAIDRIKTLEISELVINVHHFADQIISFIESNNGFGLNIHISDERHLLLDTGGGLKKASAFLRGDEPIFIQNVDIIASFDYQELLNYHINSKSLATLAVSDRKSSRYLMFNEKQQLSGWENVKTGNQILVYPDEPNLQRFAFSGIHVVSPLLFDLMPDKEIFSVIELYLELAKTQSIRAFKHSYTGWFDVGNSKNLEEASAYLNQKGINHL